MCCEVALMHGHKWLEPDELLWRLHPKWFLQDSPLQLGKRFLCTCGKSGSAGRSTALLNSLMMYWYIMIYSKYYLESIIQKNIILWCIQTVDMVREFTRSQIHVLSSCSDARGQVSSSEGCIQCDSCLTHLSHKSKAIWKNANACIVVLLLAG